MNDGILKVIKENRIIKPVSVLILWGCVLLLMTQYILEDSKRIEFVKSSKNESVIELERGGEWQYAFSVRQEFSGVRVRNASATGAGNIEMTLLEAENGTEILRQTVTTVADVNGEAFFVLETEGDRMLPGGSYEVTCKNISDTPVAIQQEGGLSVYCYSNIPRLFFMMAFFLFSGGVVLLYCLRRNWLDRPERFTMISLPVIGICLIILIPGWSTADFYGHWPAVIHHANRLTGLAEEHDYFLTVRQDDMFYLEEVMLLRDEWYHHTLPCKRYYLDVWKYTFEPCKDNTFIVSDRAAPALMRLSFYSIWNYMPYSLVCIVCRWLNIGLMGVLLCCRLFSFVLYVFCICHAVKRMPLWYGKWAIAVFSLIPVSVKTLTSITYDAMVLVVIINLTAMIFFLKEKREEKWHPAWVAELIIWCFLLGAVKGGGYIVFALLILLLLQRPVRDRKNLFSAISFAVSILTLLYYDVIRFTEEASFFQLETLEGQWSVSFALSHPGTYLDALFSSIIQSLGEVFHMGMQAMTWGEENLCPWYVSVAFFFCMIVAIRALSDRNVNQSSQTGRTSDLLAGKDRAILATVLLLMLAVIPAS
ncbi:MAG: DUF2142 domain-containing protein, partial [Lachnospiraceae bacterium]|nr:DUF2142 domain-containing protein [Lachnospiraceae bacterium]